MSMKVRITIMIMRDMNTKAMTMSMRPVVPIPMRSSLRKPWPRLLVYKP